MFGWVPFLKGYYFTYHEYLLVVTQVIICILIFICAFARYICSLFANSKIKRISDDDAYVKMEKASPSKEKNPSEILTDSSL